MIAALFYAWKVTVRLAGTGYWAISFVGIGLGEVLYAVYVYSNLPAFAAVGYIIEITGIVLLVRGCDKFISNEKRFPSNEVIALCGILGSMLFSVQFPNPSLRLLVGNAALSILFIKAAVSLFAARSTTVRQTMFAVALILGIIGFFEFSQATLVVITGNPFIYSESKSTFLVLYCFLFTALAVTLLQLGYSRFQNELHEKSKDKEILLKEMHHRTKNNLALVSSLVTLESSEFPEGSAKEAFIRIDSRIRTVALLHEQLQHSGNTRMVDTGEYLSQVLKLILPPSNTVNARIVLENEVASFPIDMTAAIPLGLIINELATNALKHAFPGNRDGKILVRFGCDADQLELVVADDGVGMPENLNKESLGMSLVRALTDQLRGNLRFETNNGTRIILAFPASVFACSQDN
ncbi:MAG: sensor histidine kinase [Treponemataceae bacterium]